MEKLADEYNSINEGKFERQEKAVTAYLKKNKIKFKKEETDKGMFFDIKKSEKDIKKIIKKIGITDPNAGVMPMAFGSTDDSGILVKFSFD